MGLTMPLTGHQYHAVSKLEEQAEEQDTQEPSQEPSQPQRDRGATCPGSCRQHQPARARLCRLYVTVSRVYFTLLTQKIGKRVRTEQK